MSFVSKKLAVVMLLTAACWGGGSVKASGPDSSHSGGGHSSGNSKVVTESETKAKLTGAAGQMAASGCAESDLVTVTNTATNTSTTNAVLTISVKRLTIANGAIVTFSLNGTSIGTGTVNSGQAKLKLSTKKGDTVPAVSAGDTLTVVDPDGSTVDLMGTFGPLATDTETSGH